jgi:hypothetical protein
VELHQVPEWFNSHDLTSDTLHRVGVRAGSSLWNSRLDSKPEMSYMMAVGTGRDTKSLLTGFKFTIIRVDPSQAESLLDENHRKYRCVELLEC